jgi:formylglycine-generating enzyme required for sulfatase activity
MTSPATLSDFRLDRYEVTVGRFRQFVSAGMGTQTTPPTVGAGARTLNGVAGQGGWDPSWNTSLATDTSALVAAVKCDMAHESWTDIQGGNEAVPMNCVTWFEAMAFCVWDGGFLPTEAEWNYAAAGGGEQRAYPWSIPANDVTLDCSHANYFNGTAYCASPPNGAVNRVGSESPRGDGRWGQSDLAGNLWEWALDWSQAVYATPCGDCANLTVATNRIVRSTGFYAIAASLRNGERDKDLPASRRYALGVRCARVP